MKTRTRAHAFLSCALAQEKRAITVSSVCVCVIAWARRAVCGWGSLDCCSRVCVCGGAASIAEVHVCVWGGGGGEGEGECLCECMGVGVTG